MVRQIIAFMHSEDGFLGPINLGTPNEASLRELAETIVWLAHLKSRVEFRPLPSSHPERRRPNNSRNGAAQGRRWRLSGREQPGASRSQHRQSAFSPPAGIGDAICSLCDDDVARRCVTDLTEKLAFIRPEKVECWSVVRSRFAYPVYDLAAVRHAAA